MSEVNPVLGYADSYRRMARIAKAEGQHQMVDMFSVVTDLERNIAPLFTAAKSELAALREELATAKRNEHNSEVAYKAAIEKQEELREELREELTELEDEFDTLEHSNISLKLSLQAAEQRNAILTAGLKEIITRCNAEWSCHAIELTAEEALEDAALKPTESARCSNCDRATAEQCDDAGCGFLGSGNGAPTDTKPTESGASDEQ
jgi:chromosome segregation ATPase